MRITGGRLCGRRFAVPKAELRPTQDRVREALFSILAARIPECRFLDLFAGSGGVGLEAWSRGAAFVCWVEKSRRCLPVLRRNVEELCGEGAQVIGCDVLSYLRQALPSAPFDLVYCDPPYRSVAHGGHHGQADRSWPALILPLMAERGLLASDGLVIVEQEAGAADPVPAGWTLADERTYGGSRLRMFGKMQP